MRGTARRAMSGAHPEQATATYVASAWYALPFSSIPQLLVLEIVPPLLTPKDALLPWPHWLLDMPLAALLWLLGALAFLATCLFCIAGSL